MASVDAEHELQGLHTSPAVELSWAIVNEEELYHLRRVEEFV